MAKNGIKKGNVCHRCGQPPTKRDKGMLTMYKRNRLCGDCLVGGYDDEGDIRRYAEEQVWGGSCPLGAAEDLLPEPVPSLTIKDRDNISRVAKECGTSLTSREWSRGGRK